jgi:hypothetical protein
VHMLTSGFFSSSSSKRFYVCCSTSQATSELSSFHELSPRCEARPIGAGAVLHGQLSSPALYTVVLNIYRTVTVEMSIAHIYFAFLAKPFPSNFLQISPYISSKLNLLLSYLHLISTSCVFPRRTHNTAIFIIILFTHCIKSLYNSCLSASKLSLYYISNHIHEALDYYSNPWVSC